MEEDTGFFMAGRAEAEEVHVVNDRLVFSLLNRKRDLSLLAMFFTPPSHPYPSFDMVSLQPNA
jgi:hypothetical protein